MAEKIESTEIYQGDSQPTVGVDQQSLTLDQQIMRDAYDVANTWEACAFGTRSRHDEVGYAMLSSKMYNLAQTYGQIDAELGKALDPKLHQAIGEAVVRLERSRQNMAYDNKGWNMLSPAGWGLRRILDELERPPLDVSDLKE